MDLLQGVDYEKRIYFCLDRDVTDSKICIIIGYNFTAVFYNIPTD